MAEWFYKLTPAKQKDIASAVRRWPWAIELDTGSQSVGLIHANVLQNSWPDSLSASKAVEEAWLAGTSLEDKDMEATAWDRTLAKILYRRVPSMGETTRTVAEYKRLSLERLSTLDMAQAETLILFKIDGIDAFYLGHNFVPRQITIENCHFLDTYRGEKGEQLSLVCVNQRREYLKA